MLSDAFITMVIAMTTKGVGLWDAKGSPKPQPGVLTLSTATNWAWVNMVIVY
jgi:hypothetical protein